MIDQTTPIIIFPIIAILEVAMGIYVFYHGKWSLVNRYFLIVTLLAALGSLLNTALILLTQAELALLVVQALIFFSVIKLAAAYYLNTVVTYDLRTTRLKERWSWYVLIVLVLALVSALSAQSLSQDEFGWVFLSFWPIVWLTILLLTFIILLFISLARKTRNLQNKMQNVQTQVLTIALAFPAIFTLFIWSLDLWGFHTPRVYGLVELVSIMVLSFGIVKYDLFSVKRVQEKALVLVRSPPLHNGRAYLFEASDNDRMFQALLQEMEIGTPALIICRTHPDQLRARYHLLKTPLIWLAQSPGPDRIDPSNLQLLTHLTLDFMRKGHSIIAIEGLEFLLVNNELTRVLKFIGQLRDHVIVEDAILLLTADPRTLTEKQKAILERELELVE
ncbi:MAG: DUF835 domain-containing protein [Methanomassiliicoccus sp.]|nr:MAG: DUF835 domain-containing protein [Methanomassiliicoccus sp.]